MLIFLKNTGATGNVDVVGVQTWRKALARGEMLMQSENVDAAGILMRRMLVQSGVGEVQV